MQRHAFPALITTCLLFSPALAGPLDLNAHVQPQPAANAVQSSIGSIFATPAPSEPVRTTRLASADVNLGGGFLEMLFRGPATLLSQGAQRSEPQDDRVMQASLPQSDQTPDVYELDNGTRVQVDPRYLRQVVSFDGRERPGTIIINTRERMLYLVQENGQAIRYGIGVGRPGFAWAGTHTITNMREWPDWRPPAEMLRRQPHLPRHMRGGPDNPLGARAMYLGSTLYRIHGSNEPWTIGQAVSSGCIRMRNEDVIDLYQRVRVGTRVVVI
jgi:lipoprotein-anchoring transpeptidase ErfK/SrfK